MSAGISRPFGLKTPPEASETPTIRHPSSFRNWAVAPPTLPKPWTATVHWSGRRFRCCSASRITIMAPRPVAVRRPSLPPMSIGLPVTTPGAENPTFME